MRPRLALLTGIGLLALLAGCGESKDARPRPKPAQLGVAVLQSDAGAPDKKVLTKGRISTKSGEILILEPDGSVSEMALDSPEGRDAFAVTEAELMALNANLDLDLSGMPDMAPVRQRQPTAQEKALADFAARTRPLRLNLPKSFEADPKDFQGAQVSGLASSRKGADGLVEVTANLRAGVDADTAFAYATCALASWADAKGAPYARHIRTLRDKRNGKMVVGSVFTLSEKKPMGLTVMTTNETLQECKARGIPAA
ncbi:hypothetical protein NM680_01700 [Paracoccus sp. PS-1]|uniref:hypothetical protein n=1 Tax=unclassified Paracoccus (in: a-proteobacteria) TaxID=2688777 RepID=UPI00048DF716|nr:MULTISPECIES: hypothetical protein [unclassified Paracoccus (in: a-proteobacteria)]MDQ7260508.1 hypothetical protein [Paracoccus sp. PS1]UFM66413.1 hypothetical protein LOS78_10755 [Paracoccus sp. MA]